jgi:hypothetical protein
MENGNGNKETATPHPALSRKGRGKEENDKRLLNTPPCGHPFLVKEELRHDYDTKGKGHT